MNYNAKGKVSEFFFFILNGRKNLQAFQVHFLGFFLKACN